MSTNLTCHTRIAPVGSAGDEIAIEPGHPHSVDFDRDDLLLAGEVGTGRLRVLVEIRSRFPSSADGHGRSPGALLYDVSNPTQPESPSEQGEPISVQVKAFGCVAL